MSAALATFRAAVAEAWANRRSFWTQLAAMFVNDIAWVAFWVLFFDEVGTVRGWARGDVLMLLAVITTTAGFVLGVTGNVRRIAALMADGELDAALALPMPTLVHLLARRIEPVNVGDIAFGVVLFAVAGHPTPARTAVFAASCALGALVYGGFLLTVGSLALRGGRGETSELAFHAITMLASYPADIFTGSTKLVLYTVVPAAFVSTVPVRLVDELDGRWVAAAVGAAVVAAGLGVATFQSGLRRYTSGSAWTRA
jgi:ABC-2 type transport system permease protein